MKPMSKLSKTFKIALALLLSVFSTNIIPATSALAATTNATGTLLPVWCQITGNHWSAQQGTGSNDQRFPLMGEFDQQYGTVTAANLNQYPTAVVGQTLWANSGGMPNTLDTACMDQYSEVTPTAPTIKTDLCGTANDMYTIPSKTGVVYKVGGVEETAGDYPTNGALSVNITAVAANGYVLTGTTSWTLTFTDETCITTITELPKSTVIGVCGLDNDIITVGAETNQYSAGVITQNFANGVAKVTYTAKQGFLFPGGATTYVETLQEVNDELCRVPVPAAPAPVDPCGPNNATWVLPADTSEYTWTIQNSHLIANTTANYVFTDGQTTHDFGTAQDSGVTCPVPAQTQPTCSSFGTLSLPTPAQDGNTYTYIVTRNGITTTYTAATLPTTLTDVAQGESIHVKIVRGDIQLGTVIFDQTFDFNTLNCIQVPATPIPNDPCGPNNATWVLPANTNEVSWSLNANGELIATALGSNFTNGQATINFGVAQDSNQSCSLTIVKTGKILSDTNKDGVLGDVGDEVSWEIIVTNTSDTDYTSPFYVQVDDPSATLTYNGTSSNGYLASLAAHQSATFTATTVLTLSEVIACKAINTATATLLNSRTQATPPLATANTSATYAFTCLTPGKGAGIPPVHHHTTMPTLKAPLTGVTPALKHAGTNSVAPVIAFITTILAFGALYFARPKTTR